MFSEHRLIWRIAGRNESPGSVPVVPASASLNVETAQRHIAMLQCRLAQLRQDKVELQVLMGGKKQLSLQYTLALPSLITQAEVQIKRCEDFIQYWRSLLIDLVRTPSHQNLQMANSLNMTN